jgi:cyclase
MGGDYGFGFEIAFLTGKERGNFMQQIGKSIHVEDQFSVPPLYRGSNWGYIITTEGVVMIDTPMVPRTALDYRDKIVKKGEVRYIVNTHHHVDHVTGNFFFPGPAVSHESVREAFFAPLASVVGSERVDEIMRTGQGILGYIRALVSDIDAESMPMLNEKNYQIKAPTITFSEKLILYVGQHTVELMHLPGHTDGHIGVYLPQEKVFFTGDNFCNGTQPSLAHSLPLDWVNSLKRIEAMDVSVVVPGHGKTCELKEVRQFRKFIETCIDMTRKAISEGMSKEEAADKISFEGLYPADQQALAVHPGSAMQRRNVLHLYDMLSQ